MRRIDLHHIRPTEIERIRDAMHSHPSGARRSANVLAMEHATRGEQLADQITSLVGSWPFNIVQSALLARPDRERTRL